MMKSVFSFGGGHSDGDASQKKLLGGKGANLAEMAKIGVPVPPGFTITTSVCNDYYSNGKRLSADLKKEVEKALFEVERNTGKKFGDEEAPLLVSVRSGSSISMPGMMDTILNLGINDEVVVALAKATSNERFAYDCYRRFIQMYSDVVMGVSARDFEDVIDLQKKKKMIDQDTDFKIEDLKELIVSFKDLVKKKVDEDFPQDPKEQLWRAICAVFNSWMSDRACFYRKINGISDDLGTAVNVQSMVFGNMGDTSGTGVAFTRDPSTGEKIYYGEYLINAQGEDVVAGIRTPKPIRNHGDSLEKAMPKVYEELCKVFNLLESHYKDVQDIEFTIENEKLWLLQTRSAKRTAGAAVKIAYDMVQEGVLTNKEALLRVDASSVNQLLHPQLDKSVKKKLIGKGLPASPGAAYGKVVFTPEDAVEMKLRGENVILARHETSPEDVEGMYNAAGIVTATGGMTSHAAVVARGMGKPCVSGVSGLDINEEAKEFTIDGFIVKEGDVITIDGSAGELIAGRHPTHDASFSKEFETILKWADEIRDIGVRANAETVKDAAKSVEFGADGVGLCRTEHMFFAQDRILFVRQMILARTLEQRNLALEKLLPIQQGDFEEIFTIMKGKPVTVRLLDPPLHEFLPQEDQEIERLVDLTGLTKGEISQRIRSLTENNPMLGHRGCRLGITYPEIYRMQAEAVFNAAYNVYKETKEEIGVEIMIPLVGDVKEISYLKKHIEEVRLIKEKEFSYKFHYSLGTMIEVPRAALKAKEIAAEVDFFSFGTNDLTQTALGISRDDAGLFLDDYLKKSIYEVDPFVELDQEGVGELVEMGYARGKEGNGDLKVGICGEHGGNPRSVEFFYNTGLDYVSCSPFRIPITRIAAAQASIKKEIGKRRLSRNKKN